jgi:hypothetical protein
MKSFLFFLLGSCFTAHSVLGQSDPAPSGFSNDSQTKISVGPLVGGHFSMFNPTEKEFDQDLEFYSFNWAAGIFVNLSSNKIPKWSFQYAILYHRQPVIEKSAYVYTDADVTTYSAKRFESDFSAIRQSLQAEYAIQKSANGWSPFILAGVYHAYIPENNVTFQQKEAWSDTGFNDGWVSVETSQTRPIVNNDYGLNTGIGLLKRKSGKRWFSASFTWSLGLGMKYETIIPVNPGGPGTGPSIPTEFRRENHAFRTTSFGLQTAITLF